MYIKIKKVDPSEDPILNRMEGLVLEAEEHFARGKHPYLEWGGYRVLGKTVIAALPVPDRGEFPRKRTIMVPAQHCEVVEKEKLQTA